MGAKLHAVNGFNISQARQVARFAFSDFFLEAKKNFEKMRYDFYLADKVIVNRNGKKVIELLSQECDVNYFLEFWNKDATNGSPRSEGEWHIIIIEQKYQHI